jgi:hypothetical protein
VFVELQGRDPRQWCVETAAAIRAVFARLEKHVIYFAGYGELGYEQEGCVRRVAAQVLADWPASSLLVHSGTLLRVGGQDGIAEIYALARELGIETSGIHPSVAMGFSDTHRVSPYCDHVFFVEDETWGGFLPDSMIPSPTLQLHLEVSHEVVVIGGGKHAADELRAFVSNGKQVRYFPAEMNHSSTREWCRRDGREIRDLRGAAHAAWEEVQSGRGRTK